MRLLPDQRIGHIVVADAADVIVVAPATARWLGSMANGIANDVVTATCLATSAPVVFAPAMDGDMWTHRATRDNVERLQRDFGYRLASPEIGSLASGQEGIGRLADLPLIVDAIVDAVAGRPVRQPDAAARPPLAAAAPDPDLAGPSHRRERGWHRRGRSTPSDSSATGAPARWGSRSRRRRSRAGRR